jgi:hypothetical protein
MSEIPELFTVYDYKQLLKHVEQHFKQECELQFINPYKIETFYNPEMNEGLIRYSQDEFYELDIRKTEMIYGNDFVTINFCHD